VASFLVFKSQIIVSLQRKAVKVTSAFTWNNITVNRSELFLGTKALKKDLAALFFSSCVEKQVVAAHKKIRKVLFRSVNLMFLQPKKKN
jgi:hypothetical protein